MKRNFIAFILISLFLSSFSVNGQENYKEIHEKLVYQNKNFYNVETLDSDKIKFKKHPKNIILLIGDGMGVSHVFAAITANKGQLYIENMKHIGFSKTQSADRYVTDSAAGGTAIACGEKTNNGAIGVDANGEEIESIVEKSEKNGKSTGIVSTSAITHATPASFIAHQKSRSDYENIAVDLVNSGVDVFIGGGYDFFANRSDDRNLIGDLEDKGYSIYRNIDDVPQDTPKKLGVLTAPKHNPKFEGRGDLLPDATRMAIDALDKSKEGFFLMVEGSMIDWGGHSNDISYVVKEMLDFDKAIGVALKYAAEHKNTLVIVTADHETGGLSIINGDTGKGKTEAAFNTGHHTGLMVPVFAFGPGAELFNGFYENTEIFKKMVSLYRFKD